MIQNIDEEVSHLYFFYGAVLKINFTNWLTKILINQKVNYKNQPSSKYPCLDQLMKFWAIMIPFIHTNSKLFIILYLTSEDFDHSHFLIEMKLNVLYEYLDDKINCVSFF